MPSYLHRWNWTKPQKSFWRHLRSIRMRNNIPELPVAQHFKSTSYSISDVQVRGVGMALCSGTDIQPKQHKMRVFLQLGTFQTWRTIKYQFQLRSLLFTRARASFLCLWQLPGALLITVFLILKKVELYTRNVCFLKTFDTIWPFNEILFYPQPVNQLDEMH